MRAVTLTLSAAAFLFIGGTSQAEIIRYRCTLSDTNEAGLVVVDTKSSAATSWTHPGKATIDNTTITVSQDEYSGFIQINRKTGAAKDDEGNTGRCSLVK